MLLFSNVICQLIAEKIKTCYYSRLFKAILSTASHLFEDVEFQNKNLIN